MIQSAGCIIVNKEGNVLLIKDLHGNWGFPKGHVEEGETLQETALREVEEEVGLQVHLRKEKAVTTYLARGKPKKVTYFLADAHDDSFLLDANEVKDALWVPIAEVHAKLTFDTTKKMFSSLQKLI